MKRFYIILVIIFALFNTCVFASESLNPKLIQKTKQGVVSVSNNIKKAAYSRVYNGQASAFLIDKKYGLFVTNAHVANDSLINNITLTTFNGRELEAKFLYSDPHKDFAFLKVEPKDIPSDLIELPLKDMHLKTYQPVFLISNNEGKDFSIQTGNIVSQYNSIGNFPQQTINISLNTRGGSSGSPVLDYDGNVVALNFAGHETYADALKIAYVIEALPFVKNGKIPPRQTSDTQIAYHSLDKSVKYQKFPKEIVMEYIAKYPDALNNALIVMQTTNGFSENSLIAGDVIWAVDGEEIGPNMYKMDHIINIANGQVKFTVYRQGIKKEVFVTPKNINKHKIDRMVVFGDAMFYEVDEKINIITGAPLGSLFVTNVEDGSSFDKLPYIYGLAPGFNYLTGMRMLNIQGFNGQEVNSLDELIAIIPALVKQKYFIVNFKNYFFTNGMDNIQMLNRSPNVVTVEYESYISDPVELRFNPKTLTWDTKKIL